MSIADVIAFTSTRFDTLRKPNGKPYVCKSQYRSILCALSSNGIFSQVSKSQLEDITDIQKDQEENTDNRFGSRELWQVNETEARKWCHEMEAKFEAQKSKLGARRRKYSGEAVMLEFQQDK